MENKEEIREHIRKNYTKIALSGGNNSCCTGGCGYSEPLDIEATTLKLGYSKQNLLNVPLESIMGLGCGNPLVFASLKQGETVLGLGSGGGFDCFLAREYVGENGYVIEVDMTPDMIKLARRNAAKSGYTNIDFRLGEIGHQKKTSRILLLNILLKQ